MDTTLITSSPSSYDKLDRLISLPLSLEANQLFYPLILIHIDDMKEI
jgi:hypothetical protein